MKLSVYQSDILISELHIEDRDLAQGAEVFIGRQVDCHIVLESHKVSRQHAVLFVEEEKLKIKSLSHFGSIKVNGTEVTNHTLAKGQVVEINEFELKIDSVPDQVFGINLSVSDRDSFDDPGDITQIVQPKATESQDYSEAGDLGDLDYNAADELVHEETVLMPNDQTSEDLLSDSSDEIQSDYEEEVDKNLEELDDLSGELAVSELEQDFTEELDSNENSEEANLFDDDSVDEPLEADDDFSGEGEVEESSFIGDTDQDKTGSLDAEFADFAGDSDEFAGGLDEEGFGDEDSKTQVLSSFAKYKLKLFGEFAPFDSYLLDDPITKIGRDPNECQIILDDPEVSKVHAFIRKSVIDCVIEDNDSSNGIILNGERVNKAELTNGDEFIIGETTFTVSISSDIIESEKGRLMPIEDNQEILIEEEIPESMSFGDEAQDELDFSNTTTVDSNNSLFAKIKNDPKKRKIAIIVGVLLAVLFLMPDPEPSKEDEKGKKTVTEKKKTNQPKISPEKLEILEQNYQLASAKFREGQYYEAKEYINIVKKIDPTYKATSSLDKSIQDSLDAIKRNEEEERRQKERAEKLKKVADLVEKAKKAVAEKKVEVARQYFSSIYELDPDNIDVPPLKLEIDSYVNERERKKQEAALAKAKRRAMEDKLKPGEMAYLKQDYYAASIELAKFLNEDNMDKDLVAKATNMLNDSNRQLQQKIQPLLSRARSFIEGQDLKQAYETYTSVLKFQPTNEEALNERERIFEMLYKRSRRVFREALIKEDLSDFANAKEKFEEVKQISPINSEYYNKAQDKLKKYLE